MTSIGVGGALRRAAFITILIFGGFVTGCASGSGATDSDKQLAEARAIFAMRCKTAGEQVHRTAENVQGIFLIKLRSNEINYGDQFLLDDQYGSDLIGEDYIGSF